MTTDRPKILCIEDDKPLADLIVLLLEEEGYEVYFAQTAKAGINALNEQFFDLIILDWFTPDLSGAEFMAFVKDNFPQTYVLVHSQDAHVNEICTKLGADDFVLKGDEETLKLAVIRGLRQKVLKIASDISARDVRTDGYQLVGVSSSIIKIRELIDTAAASHLPVVICGETGVGKEVVARNIHRQSIRSRHRFFPVNCGAIATELLESELFGHVAGAYTGATKARVGYFEYANRGTLLLDEVSAMPPDLQVKLLRTLQEGKIRRVGSNKEISVDVRIIAATNVPLDQLIQQKQFREDLYFRLNVLSIYIPPLRERRDDIAVLADYFIRKYAPGQSKGRISVSDEAMVLLHRYDFPGNIRELENIIQRGLTVALQRGSKTIHKTDLGIDANPKTESGAWDDVWTTKPLKSAVQAFEKRYFTTLLKKNCGDISQCAKQAGLNEKYLYQKFDALAIDYQKFRNRN